MYVLTLLLAISLSWAYSWQNCVEGAVGVETAVKNAASHTGKVYAVKLYLKKKTGECLYSVRGLKGYATVDANTGEVIRFTKRKK